MRQDMLQKDIEIDSLRKKLNKVLQQRKQLSIVCVSVCHAMCVGVVSYNKKKRVSNSRFARVLGLRKVT